MRVQQAKLFQFALYGEGMRACATFPVHFKKDEAGVFSVDKEKQAKVRVSASSSIPVGSVCLSAMASFASSCFMNDLMARHHPSGIHSLYVSRLCVCVLSLCRSAKMSTSTLPAVDRLDSALKGKSHGRHPLPCSRFGVDRLRFPVPTRCPFGALPCWGATTLGP